MFVRAFQLGHRFASRGAHLQHLGRALERVGHRCALVRILAARQLGLGQDEPAADRVEGFLHGDVALGIGRHQDQAVGMAGQGRAVIEDQIGLGIEGQGPKPVGGDLFRLADCRKRGLGLFGVVALGQEPGQAQDHGPVGGMADAGEGQRSVQRRAQTGHVEGRGAQLVQEPRGGHHRAHRVRRGRADADLEHVEDAQKHPLGPCVRSFR